MGDQARPVIADLVLYFAIMVRVSEAQIKIEESEDEARYRPFGDHASSPTT